MVQVNRFAGQKERHRCREKMYGHQGGKAGGGGWDELRDWDLHIYTNMYNIDN